MGPCSRDEGVVAAIGGLNVSAERHSIFGRQREVCANESAQGGFPGTVVEGNVLAKQRSRYDAGALGEAVHAGPPPGLPNPRARGYGRQRQRQLPARLENMNVAPGNRKSTGG